MRRELGLRTRCIDCARDWTTRVWFPAGVKDFSLLQNVQAGSRAHPASYSMDSCVLCRGYRGLDVTFTTYLHLKTSFRMSGAIPLSQRYTFMACTGRSLPFYLLATYKKLPYLARQKTWTLNTTPVVRYAVQPPRSVPTFQRNLMPLSCGWIMETDSSETSVHFCHTAQRDIS